MRTVEFRAMGSLARIGVVGGASRRLLNEAEDLVRECEQRWSRFLPDSELSRLNAAAGRPTLVSAETFSLVEAAVEAWHLTAGRFDPTVLPALVAAGYDRTFEALPAVRADTDPTGPAPGCAGISLDPAIGLVTLPAGVAIDLGGIAKGHTADLVVAALLDHGAAGVMAELGGDVRVAGEPPHDTTGWEVAVDDPRRAGTELWRLRLSDGAVVTSTTLRRRWRVGDRTLHHLIDPATGTPTAGPVAAAVVVAAAAASAEVAAKAAIVAGDEAASVVRAFGASGLLVGTDGSVRTAGDLAVFAA